MGKTAIEKLILTGVFDSMNIKRGILLGNLERAVNYVQNIKDEKNIGQESFFTDADGKEYRDFIFENFSDLSRIDKLHAEKCLLGFSFSEHSYE